MSAAGEIIDSLRERRIAASRSSPLPGFGVALAMSVFNLDRFLDMLVKRPVTEADELAMRIFARVTELGPTDEPWGYELLPGLSDAGIEMRAYVHIPNADVDEVLTRLRERNDQP